MHETPALFTHGGEFIRQFGAKGTGNGQFQHPISIDVDSSDKVLVGDEGNHRVQEFSSSGEYLGQFGSAGSGEGQFGVFGPAGIASDGAGDVWVSDPANNRVQKWVSAEGFDDQATKTAYDKLGRPVKYEDADGNVAKAQYDLLGRPVLTEDAKGAQAMRYDSTSGVLLELEDSGAGTFSANYNADGAMTEVLLPNGLQAKTTYDPSGEAVGLSYEKITNCSAECTWLQFGAERSVTGQILHQTSTLSSETYAYDKAGRLTLAEETPQGGNCTTRAYSFDADSNRTAMTTREPGFGGACDTKSTGATQEYEYDAADRLLGEGIEYDSFGRITSLPSEYSGGGDLETSYYVNDLTRSQTQDGVTNTYSLDAALRQPERDHQRWL